jgi:isopentenyl diphosphate isomerase/L-lactate dehydrogenase-like FMN-dependent dehydrogenase
VSGNREYNARNGFALPFNASRKFLLDVATHPSWTLGVMGKYLTTIGMPKHENYPEEFQGSITSGVAGRRPEMEVDSLNWDDIAKFRDMWPGILMLKGVNRVDDSLKALSYGVDGLVVKLLPEIAEAVGDKVTIILDSGVRRGSDIVKALALGAKAVLTGRATLYGTAVGGEAGAAKAINIIKSEFDKTMAYTGCNRTDEISTDIFFGDYGSNRMGNSAAAR